MDIHINEAAIYGAIKGIIATLAFIALMYWLSKSKNAQEAGKRDFITNAPYVLIALVAWLGCFTLVKIVWP